MDKKKSKDWMKKAIELSIENVESGNGGPFGAVVVKNGKIVATGVNQVTQFNDPTAHAEVMAIRNACQVLNTYQLDGCELYTSCEPCPMCLGAIYWSRPDKVFYGNSKEDAASAGFDDKFIYDEIAKPIEKRKIFTKQIFRKEALQGFLKWDECEEKIKY